MQITRAQERSSKVQAMTAMKRIEDSFKLTIDNNQPVETALYKTNLPGAFLFVVVECLYPGLSFTRS